MEMEAYYLLNNNRQAMLNFQQTFLVQDIYSYMFLNLYKVKHMKTFFTLLLISIVTLNANSQNTEKEEYLIARTKGSGDSYVLYLDYSNYTIKENYPLDEPINDSLGKTMKFKSESAALNYIAKLSWTMFAVLPSNTQGVGSVTTKYIFKRKVVTEMLSATKPPTVE